jgi:peptide/nickel transport system substrate-binding protein
VAEAPEGASFFAFLMNINQPPFDNVKVRQAFQYAINRDEIAQTAFHGAAEPFLVPYAKTSWAYAADLETYYTYDPEKAKALLAEAGYPDGFSTEMLIRGTSGLLLDQAQVFQQQLAAIGVQVELIPTELPQYWPQLFDSQFAIVSHNTGDATVDPSGLFEGAACCRPFRNFFGVQDRTDDWFLEYEDVIFQARELTDRTERAALYHRALEILLEQAWTIPTVWNQEVYAHWDYVHDYRTDTDGAIWLHEAYLTK